VNVQVLNAFRHHRNSHSGGFNSPVCRMLQSCFRASLGFAIIISSFAVG
jgi:hypothetical protein